MRIYNNTIAAGASVTIHARGRFVRGISADSRYSIQIDGGAATPFETGIAFETPAEFQQIRITNTAAASQAIEVAISERAVFDNRLVGNVDISGGIRAAANRESSYGNATIGAAAAVIVAANASRGEVLVQNVHATNTLYIGTDNAVTVANGLKVGPGGSISLTVDDDVYGIADAAGTDVRYLDETL